MGEPVMFAGVLLPTSKTGKILPKRLAKLLREPALASKVRVVQTSTFDGMIDGSASVHIEVPVDKMADYVSTLSASGRSGDNLYLSNNGYILRVSTYVDSYSIIDVEEEERRKVARAAVMKWDVNYRITNGRVVSTVQEVAAVHIAREIDGLDAMAFDEAIEKLRANQGDPMRAMQAVCLPYTWESWAPTKEAAYGA